MQRNHFLGDIVGGFGITSIAFAHVTTPPPRTFNKNMYFTSVLHISFKGPMHPIDDQRLVEVGPI